MKGNHLSREIGRLSRALRKVDEELRETNTLSFVPPHEGCTCRICEAIREAHRGVIELMNEREALLSDLRMAAGGYSEATGEEIFICPNCYEVYEGKWVDQWGNRCDGCEEEVVRAEKL